MARSFPFGGTGPPSRIRVAFEEVNRLPVVRDVALKLQRARLLLCRGYKLWYQRRELVHLIDGNVNTQYTCSLRIPASMVRRLKAHTTTTIGRNCQPLELRNQFSHGPM
jgi:hypothetical protein